ncbi:MAG: CoB--CoM heterodisulfide reductase iron-sulfur subunit A family protein [Dehalococcoidia bacterium]|nr:CoB--CoM heterodisulfide reductase iron-sulfur subunit A family protein [Dehalococcoidia bacterium]
MEPRIGVYICHCGSNIAGTVDCAKVSEFAKTLPYVVVARDYTYMCSDPGQNIIKDDIKNNKLNRVVVASCSPRMHEPTFRRAVADAGLNQYLFEMANIREHCSWVHEDRDKATDKAKALVSAAVRRVFYHEPLESKEVGVNPNTLVVGGGVAGIQAALEIAAAGKKVYLVERSPSIGGHMAQFDKTFPTLDCSACILTPKMTQAGQDTNIELLTYSEVKEVSGYIGNFKVKVNKKAKYVDPDRCTGCGKCSELCPQQVPSEYEEGLGKRKAAYIAFPQAVPNKAVIDRENCTYFKGLEKGKENQCRLCKIGIPKKNQPGCEANAIDFNMKDEIVELEVGNIILATGFQQFNPEQIYQYGYKRYPNVFTGLEFERLSNASGLTGGNVILADGRKPESIAILHCVGSRDENYHIYCSRVCCMYSLKYAHLLREKVPEAAVYQMYIDMRCPGSGYEEFYNRLQKEGVNFIRGRAAEITDIAESPEEKGRLMVLCEDTLIGRPRRIPVDMVILSCALEPQADAADVARIFTISRKADGFFLEKHPKLDPVATATDGVYVVGCCQGPKDIPDTVAQASAAAARALALIIKGKVEIEGATAFINPEKCSGCKVCVDMCPYKAINFDEAKKISQVNEVLCKGCGTCVAACPSAAIKGKHFTTEEIMAEIEGVLI